MSDSGAKTEALLKWISTFGEVAKSPNDVSDGVAMSKVLARIDPNHFSAEWRSKLKQDIPKGNKHLRLNNLRKVLAAIVEYYSELLNLQLEDFPMPQLNKVADGHVEETGRLIQLILGCAINCAEKQEHIEAIMNLEESVQQLIMQSIQELLDLQSVTSDSNVPNMTTTDVRKLIEDLDTANVEREDLKQKCHELENQVKMLQEDKLNISAEFEHLHAQLSGKTENVGTVSSDTGIRYKELKKQLETTQEDLYKMEKERDELTVKVEEMERAHEESIAKEAELQTLADQARSLKDEVDILRETSDKVDKYEATIEAYKKKMEELGDLKRQVKLLEDKNTTLMQANMDLEEDVKKTGNWRPQIDAYKKQIAELHNKAEKETKRADRLDFETKKLLEKLEALSVERDRLQTERDDLKESNLEMNDQLKMGERGSTEVFRGPAGVDNEPDSGILEMIPPSVKERLLRLQHENKRLKEQHRSLSSGGGSNDGLLQTMVDDLKEREAKLESNNRSLNQRILELESKLEDCRGTVPRVPGSREELELKLSEASKKITALSDTVHKKELEMQGMEERYKKYIEKAKSVIKTLDPKQNPNAAPEVSALRSQLNEKDRLIETLEQETEKARAVREMEERLISSAFYNLSMQMHRSTVEARLSNVHSSASHQGQSFLARQRQVPHGPRGQPATPQGTSNKPSSHGRGGGDFLDY